MDRESLRHLLREELQSWSSKSYDRLLSEFADAKVLVYDRDPPEHGQVEVLLLEKTPEYVHVGVSILDGGWRTFFPWTPSFLVYRDGRVDCPEI